MTDAKIFRSEKIEQYDLKGISAVNYKKGDVIFTEGDFSNGVMYFIISGQADVYKNRGGKDIKINTMKVGEFFGEVAIVSIKKKRIATVIISSETARLAEINKDTFSSIAKNSTNFLMKLMKTAITRLKSAESKVDRLVNYKPVFMKEHLKLPLNEVGSIDILDYVGFAASSTYFKGQNIYAFGEKSNGEMYFLISGELSILKNNTDIPMEITVLQAGELFGELGLVSEETRSSTVKVKSGEAQIVSLDRRSFIKICKTNPTFLFGVVRMILAKLTQMEDKIAYLEKETDNLQ
ncbi:MAG: cyclic nucleotide-binding domain-containing protein [Leptospiraceae bacterium]|nr:cyclic nucleotide-binding domain-containing protein [Leptospiraceae bacterium]MCP5500990.1 cyclic nucleotide-binding domain-containing protein [Leptospiraceae bacterium]